MTKEEFLRGVSILFLAKAKKDDVGEQEFQALRVDGHLVVSSNFKAGTSAVGDSLSGYEKRDRLGSGLVAMLADCATKLNVLDKSVVSDEDKTLTRTIPKLFWEAGSSLNKRGVPPVPILAGRDDTKTYCNKALLGAGSAEVLAKNLDTKNEGQLHILSGTGDVHAEQNLLLALTHWLAAGNEPEGEPLVYGVKPPCSACEKVLEAYAAAYQAAYGKTLGYDRSGDGRQGNNQAKNKISLVEFSKEYGQKFTTFLTTFRKLRTWV